MTREGAIIILGNIPIDGDECYSIPQYQQAKTMAIEALEQLTSYEQTINKLTKAISEQEPKTGHWIFKNGKYRCNVCGEKAIYCYRGSSSTTKTEILTKYCPNCGAKMRNEE